MEQPQEQLSEQQPSAPDRAAEKEVSVPQNETSVQEQATDAAPTDNEVDSGNPPQDANPTQTQVTETTTQETSVTETPTGDGATNDQQ